MIHLDAVKEKSNESSGFHPIQRLSQAWLAGFWKDTVVKKRVSSDTSFS